MTTNENKWWKFSCGDSAPFYAYGTKDEAERHRRELNGTRIYFVWSIEEVSDGQAIAGCLASSKVYWLYELVQKQAA